MASLISLGVMLSGSARVAPILDSAPAGVASEESDACRSWVLGIWTQGKPGLNTAGGMDQDIGSPGQLLASFLTNRARSTI
uniref:Putative secreted protein n=1 Tax=Ixodes ricinus TaxID=34613 RepID=A0A6B0U1T0_IXORI